MSDWQDISTAPRFKPIEVGGWSIVCEDKKWTAEIARKGFFFWSGHYNRDRHTAWRELPKPPKESK
jgi:hypothetical protein